MTTIKEAVREKYSRAAVRATSCCGSKVAASPITSNLYSDQESGELPETALLASLGCGNP
ncbi:MAG: arsenite S-adenosylmethyltransferase, partial [Hyphomicrobiales bacterium]|nr:arsenite S-adenosylmethyltransferase [Hyphomicrobiales bacterium]